MRSSPGSITRAFTRLYRSTACQGQKFELSCWWSPPWKHRYICKALNMYSRYMPRHIWAKYAVTLEATRSWLLKMEAWTEELTPSLVRFFVCVYMYIKSWASAGHSLRWLAHMRKVKLRWQAALQQCPHISKGPGMDRIIVIIGIVGIVGTIK